MPTASPLFDEIYAVGDSLSDSGGIYELSSLLLDLVNKAGINTGTLQPIPISPPYARSSPTGRCCPKSPQNCSAQRCSTFPSAAPRRSARCPSGPSPRP